MRDVVIAFAVGVVLGLIILPSHLEADFPPLIERAVNVYKGLAFGDAVPGNSPNT